MAVMPSHAEELAKRFDVVTVVWGEQFRTLFLDVCVPNQLTAGNLGALPAGSRYRVFTSPEDVPLLEASPVLRQVRDLLLRSLEATRELGDIEVADALEEASDDA